ncbi:hypothetical protein Taro_014029 [Colocasia esculenta]|uniref:FYVE-type domain-containing protein n=1 Tax=Colocasia esculenta TaxID=4460 RepID=A0A843UDL3_COLES|nr:hypothetical protein [Colocasia esculenta]
MKSKDIVSYSSLPKFDEQSHYHDDSAADVWSTTGGGACTSDLRSFSRDYSYKLPFDSDCGGGYDTMEYGSHSTQSNIRPEVNFENVLKGIIAIITGRNRNTVHIDGQKVNSNISFLEAGKNGDSLLHSSVYAPSAPSLRESEALKYHNYKEVLLAEPPEWLPDSHASTCMQCGAPFKALTRGRHHCRFCGGIFCWLCTKGRCLMPVKFRQREPQRVCDHCYDRLEPLQDVLIKSISNSVQTAKHDVMDWTCSRGWLNLPLGLSMEHEIYKASNTLRSYYQIGGELTDFILVLHGSKAVKAFSSHMHFSLGAGLSAAAGPVGRVLEADLRAGDRGSGMCYTYSCSKGSVRFYKQTVLQDSLSALSINHFFHNVFDTPVLVIGSGAFLGASLEGNIVLTRMDTNASFYGDAYLTTNDILMGTVERPRAAESLYAALDDLFESLGC